MGRLLFLVLSLGGRASGMGYFMRVYERVKEKETLSSRHFEEELLEAIGYHFMCFFCVYIFPYSRQLRKSENKQGVI